MGLWGLISHEEMASSQSAWQEGTRTQDEGDESSLTFTGTSTLTEVGKGFSECLFQLLGTLLG